MGIQYERSPFLVDVLPVACPSCRQSFVRARHGAKSLPSVPSSPPLTIRLHPEFKRLPGPGLARESASRKRVSDSSKTRKTVSNPGVSRQNRNLSHFRASFEIGRKMLPNQRQIVLKSLSKLRPGDSLVCREVESHINSLSSNEEDYVNLFRRTMYNLSANQTLHLSRAVYSNDKDLARGTLLERIEQEQESRKQHFQNMLQEKYDELNDKAYTAIVRCRRCGSEEIAWEELQTRSADEAATLYCACTTCKNRWVIR